MKTCPFCDLVVTNDDNIPFHGDETGWCEGSGFEREQTIQKCPCSPVDQQTDEQETHESMETPKEG